MNLLLGIDELAERVGIDPRGQVSSGPPGPERTRVLAMVDRHEDALLRSCRPGHLTGSALVVDPSDRRILGLFHTKLQRWLQPGGHADGDGDHDLKPRKKSGRTRDENLSETIAVIGIFVSGL